MLDDTPTTVASTSAPSTPCVVRRKAPPKPPRIRSIFEPLGPHSPGAVPQYAGGGAGATLPPHLTPVNSVDSLKSSLAYVTNTLDRSVARSDNRGSLVMRQSKPAMAMKNKIFHVLLQLKDFLVHEVNPVLIVEFLYQHDVINASTHQELRKCRSADAMCEMLLDVICSKGRSELEVMCSALRIVERHDYLADLIHVVERLIDLGTPGIAFEQRNCTLSRTTSARMSHPQFGNHGNHNPVYYQHMRSVPHDESLMNGIDEEPPSPESEKCPECTAASLSQTEVVNECSTFDIEVSFLDIQAGEIVPNETIKQLKRRSTRNLPNQPRKRLSSVDSYLLQTDKENADRYLPVLSVSLYNRCLFGRAIHSFTHLLERYKCIRELSLAKNHLDLKGMDRIGRALYRNRGLQKLDLRLNTLTEEGAACLSQGLRMNSSLRTLNVSSTGLTGRGCSNLLEGLVKNLTLVELDIGFNDIQDDGCIAVAKLLGSNCNLRRLRMRHNSITDKGLTVLCRSLKRNARLSVLDVASNKFGAESTVTLAEALLCNRTLRELNLEKCSVSLAGCISLARALKTNTTLRNLDLSMNRIGDFGAEALSDGLKYNQVLDTLCLNMCKLTNLGFMKILHSMRFNTTMSTLKVCYNDIGRHPGNQGPQGQGHNTSLDTSFLSSAATSPNTSLDTISFQMGSHVVGDPGIPQEIPDVEEVYEKLAQILQFNKNLKVLLWGNKLPDPSSF